MKKTIIIFGIILSILLIKSTTFGVSVYSVENKQSSTQVQQEQQPTQTTTAIAVPNEETGETATAVAPNDSMNANQQNQNGAIVYSQNKPDTIAKVTNQEDNGLISEHTKGQLVEIGTTALKSIEDYQKLYGNPAVSAISEYVLGTRHLESQEKGFSSMIAIVTALVICQLLPLIFAIIVRGWRG